MATLICVNIRSGIGNGLLPDGTKLLLITLSNVDLSWVQCNDINLSAISQEMPQPSTTKLNIKITYPKFY